MGSLEQQQEAIARLQHPSHFVVFRKGTDEVLADHPDPVTALRHCRERYSAEMTITLLGPRFPDTPSRSGWRR